MIVGIDPAYTTTGVAIADDNYDIIETFKIKAGGNCYDSIVANHEACLFIYNSLYEKLRHLDSIDIIIEYPALATRSGAYLAILNGYLSARLQLCSNVKSITWVPPTACDSFIKNKEHSKSFIVNYCLTYGLLKKKVTHDECTAAVFVKLLQSIMSGEYKNKSFRWTR